MPNMSYCRFQNTRNDFQDCLYALNDIQEEGKSFKQSLSKEEYRALQRMIEQAEELINLANYDEDLSDE